MRGNNKLLLNESTVIEAVQEYLTNRTKENAPKVTGVDIVTFEGGRYFRVSVSEEE